MKMTIIETTKLMLNYFTRYETLLIVASALLIQFFLNYLLSMFIFLMIFNIPQAILPLALVITIAEDFRPISQERLEGVDKTFKLAAELWRK